MGEVVLFMEELKPSSAIVASCRICHGDEEEEEEEEESQESCKNLEVPCACSGTLMFAHRDCIQRWCNQKGNTTCEICLQKFEPGYTTPPSKSQLIDAIVTISSELAENRSVVLVIMSRYISLAKPQKHAELTKLTFLLLARHLLLVLSTGGMKDFPFTLVTLIILRASEILLTMYLLVWIIMAIRNNIRCQH
ncbi:hypothetical protein RHGRI_003115 [Rhododendron griersonianum]|uniref:RING-CH-type domain-containing protein n=1 Tax=Rhododendron griersonianum TaxID=479676 RepID=A0AAV6LTZ1_9ERIC|nr:hypothetical protein RHGRI_003115 [Rhododendron griersonianum]